MRSRETLLMVTSFPLDEDGHSEGKSPIQIIVTLASQPVVGAATLRRTLASAHFPAGA